MVGGGEGRLQAIGKEVRGWEGGKWDVVVRRRAWGRWVSGLG